MAVNLKLSVVFQSRVGDGVECTPDKILLHSTDIKTLKLKIGAFVEVEMPSSTCICRVWPSKKAVVGSATMNKIWHPNFPVEQRKIKITSLLPNWLALSATQLYCWRLDLIVLFYFFRRLMDCAEVSFQISTNSASSSSSVTSLLFNEMLRSMLSNVPLRIGMAFGLTMRCESLVLQVRTLILLTPYVNVVL